MVLDHESRHVSRLGRPSCRSRPRSAVQRSGSNEWVKKAEIESGRRAGVPTELAERLKALERENRELRPGPTRSCAKGVSMFCDGGARPSVDVRVSFIDAHRGAHGVEPICKQLPIAPSTCHDHVARRTDPARLSDHARRDEPLRLVILPVFEENWRVHGVRHRSGGRSAGKASTWLGSHGGEAHEGHGPSGPHPRPTAQDDPSGQGGPLSAGSGEPPVPGAGTEHASRVSHFTYVATW